MRPGRARLPAFLYACGLLVLAPGCDREGTQTSRPSQTSGPEREVAAPPTPEKAPAPTGESSVRPTYRTGSDAPDAVKRLCAAIWQLPRDRRQECCGGKPSGIRADSSCLTTVTAAIEGGGVELDESKLASCEEAAKQALESCDWVGNLPPAPPEACRKLLRPLLEKGAPCRSSLECKGGLRCAGAGPTDRGVCREPGAPGAYCDTAVDPLAAAAAQSLDAHPACEGFCRSNRCRAAVPVGGKCSGDAECGAAAWCDGTRCKAGAGEAGAACVDGGCSAGLRCVDRVCIEPGGEGADCTHDLQCRGACVKADGADSGACGMRCARVLIPK